LRVPPANRFSRALYRRRPPFPWNVPISILAPVGWLYGQAMRLRAYAYHAGWLTGYRPGCRVVSVGNLTMGGTGKTPLTIFLARALIARGKRVAIVSRGYHGALEGKTAIVADGHEVRLSAAEAGDEPFLMANSLPGVPVLIGAKRPAAVALAEREFSPDIILCDDAFSHLPLKRDLDLALVHGRDGLGNGRVVPGGPLREPAGALKRADVVVLNITAGDDPGVTDQVLRTGFSGSVLKFRYGPLVLRFPDGRVVQPAELDSRRVVAFAATARPNDFFVALARAGCEVVETAAFADHHAYAPEDMKRLTNLAAQKRICYLATTEKDAVKLPAAIEGTVRILVAQFELIGEGDALDRLVCLAAGDGA
jgi:tetraacyldisaccharide 4'-kinase